MNYRKSRRILSRPSARVQAAIEEGKRANAIAREQVRAMLAQPGADVRALYQAETDRERRVVLLGVLRRGLGALS